MKVLLAESSKHLLRSLLSAGCDIGKYENYFFADGERGYRLNEKVTGKSVAVIGSILPRPESLFELIVLHRLAAENGARKTSLFIPYLGYARQDRPSRPGEGSIGIMIVQLLRKMKSNRLVLFDIHSDLIRRALGSSALELTALPLFAEALSGHPPDVIVSPDAGFVSRAKKLSKLLGSRPEVAVIDKVRPRPNVAIAKELHGDVRGKNVLIVDDIIDTGGTLREAVYLVSQNGARSIRLAATHGIFSRDARDRLSKSPVREILITNTLPQIRSPKIRILNIAPLIAKMLKDRGPSPKTGLEA
jgi:ribose-phosphate pyrophosphokinase